MNITELFEAFSRLKVLIIGDVMIDSYVWGSVERISPEAPVPIVNAKRRESRLGGAGNVALNVQALGANPILCSVIGNDEQANEMEKLLQERQLSTKGLIRSEKRPTTIKHRILAGSQHLLRIDSETTAAVSEEDSQKLVLVVQELAQDADVIIFEDYDKGVLTEQNIEQIIAFANQKNIPTAVDPKKRNFLFYKNCSFFKPNLKELKEGLNISVEATLESLEKAVAQLREKIGCQNAMITLSEYGVFIDKPTEKHLIAAHKREIADVSGAGDTVISVAALCLALGTDLKTLASLSNLGGGLVCEYLGVVPINLEVFRKEAQKIF